MMILRMMKMISCEETLLKRVNFEKGVELWSFYLPNSGETSEDFVLRPLLEVLINYSLSE